VAGYIHGFPTYGEGGGFKLRSSSKKQILRAVSQASADFSFRWSSVLKAIIIARTDKHLGEITVLLGCKVMPSMPSSIHKRRLLFCLHHQVRSKAASRCDQRIRLLCNRPTWVTASVHRHIHW